MEQQFRASRYNWFVPLGGGDADALAYNALSSSLLMIAPDLRCRLELLARTQATVGPDDELAALIPFGLMIPADFDELSEIRERARKLRGGVSNLVLTIAPTLSCDFRCGYCFQDHPPVYMGEEVLSRLIKFVAGQANDLESMGITWFGGEPLLATPTIHRLSKAFSELAERHDFKLRPASIITNGWGLTERNCRLLQDCGIGFMQVTLDGVGSVHDERRPLADGSPTFDRIVEGIETALRQLPDTKIAVRVNLEQTNAEAVDDLYEYFRARGIADRIDVNAALTQPFAACSKVKAPLTDDGANNIALRHRARRISDSRRQADLPVLKSHGYCQAQFRSAFVVSPTGALFKCWRDLSLDETSAVGHLITRELPATNGQRVVREGFETWDFTQDEECANCGVAPICGGGCMVDGMRRAEDCSRPRKVCSPYRDSHYLAEVLMLAYRSWTARPESIPTAISRLGLRIESQNHGLRATEVGHGIPRVRVVCQGAPWAVAGTAPIDSAQYNPGPEAITVCTCATLCSTYGSCSLLALTVPQSPDLPVQPGPPPPDLPVPLVPPDEEKEEGRASGQPLLAVLK